MNGQATSRKGGLAAIGISSLLLVGLLSTPGSAVPVVMGEEEIFLYGPSFTKWGALINDDFGGCVVDSNTFSVPDAEFWTGGAPNGSGTLQGDAFDSSALQLMIGSNEFVDSDNIVDKAGEQLQGGPESLGGLKTWLTYRALPDKPIIRVLFRMTNNASTAKNRTIVYDSDLGSDADSDVRATSSGDADQNPNDRWLVSSDSATNPGDVVLTWSLYGKGPVREKVDDVICEPAPTTVDDLAVDYAVRVPGNSTRYLLMFVRLTASNSGGTSAAADFDQEKSFLFKGLKPGVRDRILNWDL